jgi:DNA-binding MarR family transcriptional regulator
VFGVIHARLLELHPRPLVELLGSLMAMIVLPYRGSAASAKELERPIPRLAVRRRDGDGLSRRPLGSASPVDYRLTVRTQMALAAVAGRPGLNNREVSEVIGLSDQGQVSRIMRRLSEQGLVENTQAHSKRLVRAWRLTAEGEAVIDAHRSLKQARRATSKGAEFVAKSGGRRGAHRKIPGGGVEAGFRLTALTHEVLAQVASLNEHGHSPSNREVAQAAGVKDQGQISKLLTRLQARGLLENNDGHPGAVNAWQLTPHGEQVLSASSPGERNSNEMGAGQ